VFLLTAIVKNMLTQQICCVTLLCRMIPKFNESGLLPEGIHWAEMKEIHKRFGGNDHRRRLFSGFERGLESFRVAGCSLMYLDGSFVTAKEFPVDYDACWDAKGVVLATVDPVLLDFSSRRAAQKAKYLGEFFPAYLQAEVRFPFKVFLELFQTDKATGDRKGIIGIKLNNTV
jgi:hypothetical protein